MLLLGIPFHVSEIYRVSGGFAIASPDTSYVASLVSALIHSFRMPAFFMLSGYFAALILSRRAPSAWLRNRCVKLGVPLIATTVTLGLLERVLTLHFGAGLGIDAAFATALAQGPGVWVNHRWFLVTLLMFCTSLVAVRRYLPMVVSADAALTRSPKARLGFTAAFIVLLILIPFAAIFAGKVAGEWFIDAPKLKLYAIYYVKYGVFFATGVMLCHVGDGLVRFIRLSRFDIAMFIATFTFYVVTYFALYRSGPDTGYPMANMLIGPIRIGLEVLTGFYAAKLFFALMSRLFVMPNDIVSYFVDASFCIYLVHAVFYLVVGGLLLAVGWPPLIEMVLTCVVTVAGATMVYELARRVPWLAWPLNGGPFQNPAKALREGGRRTASRLP